MKKSRTNRGFTLLELIIVMLIISISTAIVYISISIAERKALLKDTARRIFISLRYAKEMAIMQRKMMGFVVEDNGRAYSIIQINNEEEGNYKLIKQVEIKRGIVIDGEGIVFYPLGNSTGGTIMVSDSENRQIRITVDDTTGAIKIESG
ncbi:MAG: type II secretion system protein [Nitrospirae bacterium]|nr:type II secretion system protein [Nitrospirota bacterium]